MNNAGVGGSILDAEALRVSGIGKVKVDWSKVATETYELAEECLEINYYGAKRMVDAFVGLLQLSDCPRIVNVSSTAGKLEVLLPAMDLDKFIADPDRAVCSYCLVFTKWMGEGSAGQCGDHHGRSGG